MGMIKEMAPNVTVQFFNEQHEFGLMISSSSVDITVYFEVGKLLKKYLK